MYGRGRAREGKSRRGRRRARQIDGVFDIVAGIVKHGRRNQEDLVHWLSDVGGSARDVSGAESRVFAEASERRRLPAASRFTIHVLFGVAGDQTYGSIRAQPPNPAPNATPRGRIHEKTGPDAGSISRLDYSRFTQTHQSLFYGFIQEDFQGFPDRVCISRFSHIQFIKRSLRCRLSRNAIVPRARYTRNRPDISM